MLWRGAIALFGLACLTACHASADVSDVDCGVSPKDRDYFTAPGSEKSMEETLKNIAMCFDDEADARVRAQNIGVSASAEIHEVLTALYLNAAPDAEVLRGLSTEGLNVLLQPRKDNFQHTTLLNEAVRQANYRWTRALLEAGADPNGSGSLMAYTASDEIFDPRSPWTHLFRDGAPAVPFLQAYLEFGGHLDTTEEGGYGNTALINAPYKNLAVRVFLLEQGADPWLNARPPKKRNFDLTMLGGLIFASRAADANEQLYVLIKRGLFRMPSQPEYAPLVHDFYLETLEELFDATGPKRRHELWTVQRVVNALIDIGAFEPSARMRDMLAENPVPDSEGGWILAEGQLHQDYDDQHTGVFLGNKIW